MNIRKNVDYSSIFVALDAAVQSGLQQMELYCELGRLVSTCPERGAAVAAAAYLKTQYPEATGFSPRNLRRMRDFYRLYEGNPDMLELAMQLGWTQNVVILEAELNIEKRRWYLRAAKQFGWSKTELQKAIASDTYQQRMSDEPIANSGIYDAASFPGKLVFKSRVGRFQRKQNGAASLETVESTASSVLVDSPNHNAAGWRGEGLRRFRQLPDSQLKAPLPDNDLSAPVPVHLCAQISCQPILLPVPKHHADGSGKTELSQRDFCHGEHYRPIPETALGPSVFLRKRPPAVALPIACPIVKQIRFAVDADFSVHGMLHAEQAVPTFHPRYPSERSHDIIANGRQRSKLKSPTGVQTGGVQLQSNPLWTEMALSDLNHRTALMKIGDRITYVTGRIIRNQLNGTGLLCA